jgi:hypothetical protein
MTWSSTLADPTNANESKIRLAAIAPTWFGSNLLIVDPDGLAEIVDIRGTGQDGILYVQRGALGTEAIPHAAGVAVVRYTGVASSNGSVGPQGPQGPPGADGATGQQGIQGVKGDTGLQGIQGTPGTNGTNGTNWTPVHTNLANGAVAMALATNTSVKVTPTATATYTTTVPVAGSTRVVLILTAGVSSFTITFGTGFKPTATLVTGTTAARVFAISFLSDGSNLYETGRTIAMPA